MKFMIANVGPMLSIVLNVFKLIFSFLKASIVKAWRQKKQIWTNDFKLIKPRQKQYRVRLEG